jgi:hypothetical protein
VSRFIDITGERFGRLIVVSRASRDSTGKTTWACKCECGRDVVSTGLNLKNGTTRSCGCIRRGLYTKDLSGARFGRLIALSIAATKNGVVNWKCQCDCGASTVTTTGRLRSGHTRSCGCLVVEKARASARENLAKRKHEHPRWNHSISDEERASRNTRLSEDKAWSREDMVRAGFRCLRCGNNGRLNAHHIESFARNPELRRELSNGATLCVCCHKEFHTRYGLCDFTSEHFREFLAMEHVRALHEGCNP